MADHIHTFKPGQSITFEASADIEGGRLVSVVGDRVVDTFGGGGLPIGAAAFDVKAGDDVLVLRGGVQKLVASAAITAGARVTGAADGTVVTIASGGIGTAITAATAAGQLIQIALD